MESSQQADLENIIGALQSNRSLNSISISRDVLAAIGKASETRHYFLQLGVPTLQTLVVWGGLTRPPLFTRRYSLIRYQTSNSIKFLELSGRRSAVAQSGAACTRSSESVGSLWVVLESIVFDVEDQTGFLDPIHLL
jgi:hypothetical protein